VRTFLVIAAAAILLGVCGVVGAVSAVAARDNFKKCVAEYRATPEAQILAIRIWQGDGTDNAERLSDPNRLTPVERDALVKGHSKLLQCRQIILSHGKAFAAREFAHWQALFARDDQIYTKLASGELPVGVANKLIIESTGQFQVEQSRGQADETRFRQVQGERRAEAVIQANAVMAVNQPRMTTTNCTWVGNSINCTDMHENQHLRFQVSNRLN
jgi:hypothetical protein